ncbi:50S ribosomal protein L7/L12 ['Cynodon dactylon' phytoplasma]|uniref:50S ribosomal protein L7/L12 n=1 Tax='Cynodon dactylon' phytoplasma TaxID=295320 RepID=UPI001265C853|nr:50S ribosomal protein L7/L12 ['Cynodon dactylon' phytoplasma]KAB8121997.1 50S ribosomal protein L7/L12 ['Cynodon dactylon' phytoplasma]
MSKLDKNDFIESLKKMTLSEIKELTDALKKEFNIESSIMVNSSNSSNQKEDKVENKKFNVILKEVTTDKKVPIIQLVRSITEKGLFEAKELVTTANSIIKQNLEKEKADEIKEQFKKLGAVVELEEFKEE